MWWIYFDRPVHDLLASLRTAIVWGYGHYVVFAAAAAVGAGLAVAVDQAAHHTKIGTDRRRRSRRDSSGRVPGVPLVSPLPPGVSPDPVPRPHRRGPGPAHTVDQATRVPLTGTILTLVVGAKLVISRAHTNSDPQSFHA